MIKFFYGDNLTTLEREINKYIDGEQIINYKLKINVYYVNNDFIFLVTLSNIINQ